MQPHDFAFLITAALGVFFELQAYLVRRLSPVSERRRPRPYFVYEGPERRSFGA